MFRYLAPPPHGKIRPSKSSPGDLTTCKSNVFFFIFGVIFLLLAVPANSSAAVVLKDTLIVKYDSVQVYFPVGKAEFDPNFRNNKALLDTFCNRANKLLTDTTVVDVQSYITSSTSPEGSETINNRLAKRRQSSIKEYIDANLDFRRRDVTFRSHIPDWDLLLKMVQADDNVPDKAELIRILETKPSKINEMQGSAIWRYLNKKFFPEMRRTLMIVEYTQKTQVEVFVPDPEPEPEPQPEPLIEAAPTPTPVLESTPEPVIEHTPRQEPEPAPEEPRAPFGLYLKTNTLFYLILIPNIAVEWQFADHWSVSLPFYYSALDWFSRETKFRVLGVQPEFRYWFNDNMRGFFVGAHGTFGWYNVATDGDYRYQDHKRGSPSLGGGIDAGYKIRLGRREDSRWGMEFALGAGVLPLHWDKFYNVKNGSFIEEGRWLWIGPDQASVSITYLIGKARR